MRFPTFLLAISLFLVGCDPTPAKRAVPKPIPQSSKPATSTTTHKSEFHFVHDYPVRSAENFVNLVVEIPAGTQAKWEVDKKSGELAWEERDGKPRVVQYLPYPGNYGMVPQTLLPKEAGGDGDPLDVLLLGTAAERGQLVPVEIVAVLRLLDGGEQDDKLIAVPKSGPFSEVKTLAELQENYSGVTDIIETWFTNYKGPGKMESKGFGDETEAIQVLNVAVAAYREQVREEKARK